MSRYSLAQFVQETTQKDQDHGVFELESKYMLEVNMRGRVWTKTGSMVAYQGGVRFKREGAFEHGFWSWFKRSVTGEGTNLTKVEGVGRVYLADSGKQVTIVGLSGDALCVNGNDLLAFEDGIRWDIRMTVAAAARPSRCTSRETASWWCSPTRSTARRCRGAAEPPRAHSV